MNTRVVVIALPHPEHPNMFLHLLRSDNGRWTTPAGHALPGEQPVEAARRELFEETGVDLDKLEELRNGEYPDEQGNKLEVHLFHAQCDPTLFHAKNDPDNEAVTFKYLDPTQHEGMHVPPERNILIHHIESQSLQRSEDLAKAPVLTESNAPIADSMSRNMVQRMANQDHGYKPIKTEPLPNGLFHHVLHDPHAGFFETRHTISSSKNPLDKPLALLHTVQSKNGSQPAENIHPDTWQVSHVSVMPEVRGQGVGKQLYAAAAMHHGTLASGTDMSPQAHQAWRELAQHPALSVKLGGEGDDTSVHHMTVKSKDHYSSLFTPVKVAYTPTKLAASELLGQWMELEKGNAGDWRKEGYRLQYHEPRDKHGPYALHSVTAHDKAGKMVGSLQAEDLGDGRFQAHIVEVHPQHQRKGLASAMYVAMQHKTGLKAVPDLEAQSPEGRKLWAQPGRPFGKSDGEIPAGYKVKVIPNEGGTVVHAQSPDHYFFHVKAFDSGGQEVGHTVINGTVKNKKIWSNDVFVHPAHRRKGVATAMYVAAERASRATMHPSNETHDRGRLLSGGKKLWSQKHRPFGKSDYYGRGLPMGWISPKGEFHEMDEDDHHRDVISDLAEVHKPDSDDDESHLLEAYKKGWISVGHAGEFNIQGHDSHLKERASPAMKVARQLSQNVMNEHPDETHLSVHHVSEGQPRLSSVPAEHFVKHGTILPRHMQKSEDLNKMSRPRVTFPKLGIGSEDHNVRVVATPQQRKIIQHAVAQEFYPQVPGEHRMKMQAGKAATRAVSSNQGRQRIGGAVINAAQDPSKNKSGTDKPFAFAFGGKYQQPKGEPAYPKADPSIKQARQTTLNTRIRHEGDHLVFNKLAQRLGSHEAKHKVLTKLMEHAFPDQEDRNVIYNYTRARGYNPFKDRKQTFVEEMVNSIQDILTDPPTRSQFESWYAGKHMGKPNFHGTQNMTNRLKAGWGKLAAAAMNVDETFAKAEYLAKAMDDQYLKDAHAGYTVLVPVTVAGQKELAPGIPHHITVKMFRKPPENLTPEYMKRIESDLDRFQLPVPHPKQLKFEPTTIVSPRTGKTYYSLAVHGMPKEYGELYDHFRHVGITYPNYLPHITIDKGMYDKIQSGELPLDRLDVQVHHPELKLGPNTVKVLGPKRT